MGAIVEMWGAVVVVCYPRPRSTDPDQLARDRARYEEISKRWFPYCIGSTSDQARQMWKIGKERAWLRRRIEAAERESK